MSAGCGKKNEEKIKPCKHVTIYFEDQPITFKECEGYKIDKLVDGNSGTLYYYDIKKDDKKIMEDGRTNHYNSYEVYHNVADEIINNESVQKVK